MRKYLLHVLIISFVFLLAPTVQAAPYLVYWPSKLYAGDIETYKQEVEKNPDDAQAHYNLGGAYYYTYFLENYKKAIESYKQAIRIDPDHADFHVSLGFVYNRLGKYEEAIAAYKQAIKIDPDDAVAAK